MDLRQQPNIAAALAFFAVLAAVPTAGRAETTSAGNEFFESRIRPVLVDNCYQCHSAKAKKIKGDLLLDTRDGVLKGGENGPVLVPGAPDKSRLIEAIRRTNKNLQMPPKHRLTDQQVADFVQWVTLGAPDPRMGPATPPKPAFDLAAARAAWAWSMPRDHVVPSVSDKAWCKSPIDRFILAKLQSQGLKPAPAADRRTLIRRAYFDLIGLPPTPQEVESFIADSSPDAFAKVVDRLLSSPHYGERWGRHWLDVVRYADAFDSRSVKGDTIGQGDISEAWRYRDWVVKAFNQDLPYDQFIMNQIAGDLLPADDPSQFNSDGLIATTMYVIGNWPGGDADKEKMMTDIVDDQVDVTGRAFLGMTLACARCHDHKFDPISQTDYYGLAGIFFSSHILPSPGVKTAGSPVLVIPMATPAQLAGQKRYEAQVADLQKRIDGFADEQIAKLARSLLPQTDAYLIAAVDRLGGSNGVDSNLDKDLLARWREYLTPLVRRQPVQKLLTQAVHNISGNSGVDGWIGADGRDCPNVTINSTDKTISFSTLTLPPKCVAVHPGPTTGVAIGWTSPIDGSVQIQGKVIDADPNCGDGIDWRIEHARRRGVETLAYGAFPNGGSQDFARGQSATRLEAVEVKAGDVLQVTVFPKGDYTCDTTVVELRITSHESQRRVWDITRDAVGHDSNPLGDSFGNPGVWRFFEAGQEGRNGGAAPGSALARWIDAISATPHEADVIRAASVRVRDSLVALDQEPSRRAGNPDTLLYKDLTDPRGPFWVKSKPAPNLLSQDDRQTLSKMKEELTKLKKTPPPGIETGNGMLEGGTPQSQYEGIRDWYVLVRGRYDRKGERAPRAFPRLLAGDHQAPITHGSGRLELAGWITSPDNPMTAKVMANRIWQHHFGEGIVRTPNNFGKLGVAPTHPDLLDWLALRFIDGGWSIKRMHRMIMLSAAYQQSSGGDPATMKADPGNLLIGRMNRQRLEAEPLRDTILAVSGRLDERLGGPSTQNFNTFRRTLYLMTVRSDRSNYRMLFDAADPTAIADHRIDSTVAPQALFLMNNRFMLERSLDLARRILASQPPEDRIRIDRLYRLLYGRPPTRRETDIGVTALMQIRADAPGASTEAVWQEYCQILMCANEFAYVD